MLRCALAVLALASFGYTLRVGEEDTQSKPKTGFGTMPLFDDKLLQTLAIAAADVYRPGAITHTLDEAAYSGKQAHRPNKLLRYLGGSNLRQGGTEDKIGGLDALQDMAETLSYVRTSDDEEWLEDDAIQWGLYEIQYPEHRGEIVMAIRGTELTTSRKDFGRNWDLGFQPDSRKTGAHNRVSQTIEVLMRAVDALEDSNKHINYLHRQNPMKQGKEHMKHDKKNAGQTGFHIDYITGHSMGGALAQIVALRKKRNGAAFNPRAPCSDDPLFDRCETPDDNWQTLDDAYQQLQFEVHSTKNDVVINYVDGTASYGRDHIMDPPILHTARLAGIKSHSMDCMMVNIGCPKDLAGPQCEIFNKNCPESSWFSHWGWEGIRKTASGLTRVGRNAGIIHAL